MRFFLIKVLYGLIGSVIVAILLLLGFIRKNNGSIDPYFSRITEKHRIGLILGTSRAAHSLDPDYLDGIGYNFSFAIGLSSYDSSYLNVVCNYTLHEPDLRNDSNYNFVLSVDPWVMSTYEGNMYEHSSNTFMTELGSNIYLNICIYLFNYVDLTPSNILNNLVRGGDPYVLLKNGRLSYPMPRNSARIKELSRINETISFYREKNEFTKGYY